MPDNDWKISKPGEKCQDCGRGFEAGQAYYSALFQVQRGLERRDFCGDCFQNRRPADIYYYWKTAPAKSDVEDARKRVVVDVENVLEFFKRLEGENSGQKVAFRYILALMLARKKVLIAGDTRKDANGLNVQLYREKGGGPDHAVVEPDLTADEIQGMSGELSNLLGTGEAAA